MRCATARRPSRCVWSASPPAWSSRTAAPVWRRSSSRACSSASAAATRADARAYRAPASGSRSRRPMRTRAAASWATRRRSRAARASRCRYRQLEAEARALALIRLDPDRPVHPPYELAGDVEAEPGAAPAAGQVRVDAVELVEDPALLARRDAETGVGNAEVDRVVAAPDLELDPAAVRRVLDRVVDEVRQHLPDLVGGAEDRR